MDFQVPRTILIRTLPPIIFFLLHYLLGVNFSELTTKKQDFIYNLYSQIFDYSIDSEYFIDFMNQYKNVRRFKNNSTCYIDWTVK